MAAPAASVTRLEQALASAVRGLAGSRFALVGGIAVSARTEPRFTRDLDLAVDVRDDTTAEAVVRTIVARGFRISTLVEQEAAGRLLQIATGDDLDLASESIRLIAERGFSRGRDLAGGLEAALAERGAR